LHSLSTVVGGRNPQRNPQLKPPQSQILNIIIKAQRTQINITTGIRVMTAAARNGVRTAAAHRETIATGETMAEDGLG
jgi:hypothetical protein